MTSPAQPHQPRVFFRAHDGTIHWKCGECGNYTLTPKEWIGNRTAHNCPGPASAAQHVRELQAHHQLGYVVRATWIAWAKRQPHPKPTWLVPYQDLPVSDQEADQEIGVDLVHWVLETLRLWRQVELTEGLVCERLGLSRIAWRQDCRQLGIEQIEAPEAEDKTKPREIGACSYRGEPGFTRVLTVDPNWDPIEIPVCRAHLRGMANKALALARTLDGEIREEQPGATMT